MSLRRQGIWAAALELAALLLAPAALAQVPQPACGAPPEPIAGSISFQDITTQLGYVPIAAPTTDTMSDYIGGFDSYCYTASQDFEGPWATPELAGTIALPFPFGFSGLYADGGPLSTPFQVNVWANGLLTFDPAVSFNPFAYPQQLAPPGCSGTYYEEGSGDINFSVNNGTVSDTLGGFPFQQEYSPPNGPPSALMAPWWGDLSLCPRNGSVGWLLTLDDDGLPMAIIQWTNATASPQPPNCGDDCYGMVDFSACTNMNGQPLFPGAALPQFTFQVRLHQNDDVDFVYGPSSHLNSPSCYASAVGACTYVSGIQSNLVFPGKVRPALMNYVTTSNFDCGSTGEDPGCNPSQFPAQNTSVTYRNVFRSVGPDVYVTGLSPPGLLPQGGLIPVSVFLSNGGGTVSKAEGQLQFYFSTGGNTPEGSPFSVQSISSLAPFEPCATPTFTAQVAIPAGIAPGPGYLIAEFVPGAESVDQTPSYASAAVVAGPPEPDLAVEGSLGFSPEAVVTGQTMDFDFTVANIGEVATPATVAYGIYATLSGAISPTDIQIGGGVLPAIAAGQSVEVQASFPLPLTMCSEQYLFGVIVDPTNTLGEVNLSNNVAVGKTRAAVTSLGPLIATDGLPKTAVSAPYSTQLIAGGGNCTYQWSLAGGALPEGLRLSSRGIISGQAAQAGTSGFTVEVTDGTKHSATQALTLEVDPFEQTLTIVTQALPEGATSHSYEFDLSAVGGAPPYQWALVPGAGTPPVGINLMSDGTLSGEPQYDQTASFKATVTDSAGTTVTSPLYQLTISSGGALAVGSTSLPEAVLGQPYAATLRYAGGSGPYLWSIQNIQQEPAAPGDQPTELGSDTGSALGLQFDSAGVLGGVPTRVGVFALLVQVTDSEMPAAEAGGLVLLTVTATTTFQFQTVQLPVATANSVYRTTLATNALSTDDVTFEVLNDAQMATDLAKSTLPAGLTLYSNGLIQGAPLETGSFPFLVEAQDVTTGGVATQSFTITVQTDVTPSSGCQSAPGAPALGALLLLALFSARRRRGGRHLEDEKG